MSDAGIVYQYVQATKFRANAVGCGIYGRLIDYIQLNCATIAFDAPGRFLTPLKIARTHKQGETVPRKALRDLQADSLIGPGDQGDAVNRTAKARPRCSLHRCTIRQVIHAEQLRFARVARKAMDRRAAT